MANKEKLFTEFQAPTTQEWLDKIEVDLKGADFQKRLVWRTNEGFNVQPFYRREDLKDLKTPDALPGEFPFVRGNKKDSNEWYVRQNVVVGGDPVAANKKALDLLMKGVDSIGFKLGHDEVSAEYIDALLKDIRLDIVEVSYRACLRHALQLGDLLVAYFEKMGYDKEKIVGGVGFDPIERMLMKGKDSRWLGVTSTCRKWWMLVLMWILPPRRLSSIWVSPRTTSWKLPSSVPPVCCGHKSSSSMSRSATALARW